VRFLVAADLAPRRPRIDGGDVVHDKRHLWPPLGIA